MLCIAEKGRIEIVAALLAARADKEKVNHSGDTALLCAARKAISRYSKPSWRPEQTRPITLVTLP